MLKMAIGAAVGFFGGPYVVEMVRAQRCAKSCTEDQMVSLDAWSERSKLFGALAGAFVASRF